MLLFYYNYFLELLCSHHLCKLISHPYFNNCKSVNRLNN
nr:MAG TPA: hypothetical protein [Caudoviricetes sp.]